jgi:hypothetical protein
VDFNRGGKTAFTKLGAELEFPFALHLFSEVPGPLAGLYSVFLTSVPLTVAVFLHVE